MTKGLVELVQLLLIGEGNCVFVSVDERNTNTILWNVKQSGDYGGKIPPAWFLMKICKFSRGVSLLEFESNERHDRLGDKASAGA